MMATMCDSENVRGCNTVEFIGKERGTEFRRAGGAAGKHCNGADHMQIWANQPVTC